MDYRKESDLISCCDSQSNKRLSDYRSALSSDCDKVHFDKPLKCLMDTYAYDPGIIESVRAYCDNLTDAFGVPFGRSVKQFESLLDIISGFSVQEAPPFCWNQNFKRAVEIVSSRYSTAKLKPLEYHSNREILETLSDSHTSAGFTYLLSGHRHKCDFPEEELLDTFRHRVYSALEDGSFNSYIMIYTRTQCSGEYTDNGVETHTCKHKTRPVWCVDMWEVFAELQWGKPLNQWLKSYPYSAIGKTDDDIARWCSMARSRNTRWFSVDYSRYDSTIPSWLIHTAFDILAKAFSMTVQEEKLFRVLENDFIHKNAIMPDGVLHVDHGNPSGSGLTAIINGICNEVITETWNQALYKRKLEYEIMGDDNLIFFSGDEVEFEKVASYISHNFGIKANADKGSEGRSCESPKFLSRQWTHDGPYRHPKEVISRMLYPERFRDYSKDVTPEIVFYSYILGYRAAMVKVFDVERFLMDHPNLNKSYVVSKRIAFRQLPYNVQVSWAA